MKKIKTCDICGEPIQDHHLIMAFDWFKVRIWGRFWNWSHVDNNTATTDDLWVKLRICPQCMANIKQYCKEHKKHE